MFKKKCISKIIGNISKKNCYLPSKPSFLAISTKLLPLSWFSLDTMVSAGWDTIAQKIPAVKYNYKSLNNNIILRYSQTYYSDNLY
jgi:hypothetical protein